MELYDFLDSQGVKWDNKLIDRTYSNLDKVIGKDVWICDYRYSGRRASDKPIRKVKPTLVRIYLNDEKHKVYYSPIHFREIGKSGKVKEKVIAPFDTTGYRCYTGVSLNIFTSEYECRKFFLHQLEQAKQEMKIAISEYTELFNKRIDEINKLITDNK